MFEFASLKGTQPNISLDAMREQMGRLLAEMPQDTNVTDVLTLVTREMVQSLNVRACTVRLIEGDQLSVGVAWGYKDTASRAHSIRIDQRLQKVVSEREALRIGDLDAEAMLPPARRERMRCEGFRAYLGVPMVASEQVEGILSLYEEVPREFTEKHIACLRGFADCIAPHVQRIRRLEQGRATPTTSILVVEDDPDTCFLLREILRQGGHEPAVCECGADALRYLEQHMVQLVITDLQMPEVSGWEVAQAAKRRSPQTRVLVVTGFYSQIPKTYLLKHQVDHALSKPFSPSQLMSAVSALLGK
jgi:CheY-like chemotaxis protein